MQRLQGKRKEKEYLFVIKYFVCEYKIRDIYICVYNVMHLNVLFNKMVYKYLFMLIYCASEMANIICGAILSVFERLSLYILLC